LRVKSCCRRRTKDGGLKALLENNAKVRDAFQEARARIARMELRFLVWDREDDELAILEMYAAHELQTQYNDFKTH
jgi:hypothetical protein